MTLYEEVTNRILAQLEAGVAPWVKPWAVPAPYNAATQHRYSGVNVLLLWDTPYKRPAWITYRQARILGGHVKKGERATTIVYASTIKKHKEDEEKVIPFLRRHAVFNVEQVEELPSNLYAPSAALRPGTVDAFLAVIPADVRHGGTQAFYHPTLDFIQVPDAEHFVSHERYWSTLLHETVHWSGHPSRLKRDFGERFGDQAYAFEELIAEIGSAYLSADLGLSPELHHAEYVGRWITLLRDHRRAIFTAAAKASAAAEYLKGFSRQSTQPEGRRHESEAEEAQSG